MHAKKAKQKLERFEKVIYNIQAIFNTHPDQIAYPRIICAVQACCCLPMEISGFVMMWLI